MTHTTESTPAPTSEREAVLEEARRVLVQNKRVNDAIQTALERHELIISDEGYLAALTTPAPAAATDDLWNPPEHAWNGLARQLIMWLDMGDKTPRALFKHLERSGHEIPQWLRDEPELQHLDHVPSKGTRAVIIYRAILSRIRGEGE